MAHARRGRKEKRHGKRRETIDTGREGPAAAKAAQATSSGTNQAAQAAARPPRRGWWQRDPDRYQRELDELAKTSYQPRPEIQNGRLVIRVSAQLFGRARELRVAYPDFYPYSRFEVFADALGVPKHQNPYGGNLCLLDQSTAAWSIDDTAASILNSQLNKLEKANAVLQPAPGVEVAQAEPVSFYFERHRLRFVVVPPPTGDLAGRTDGTMTIAVAAEGDELRGVVMSIDGRTTQHPRLHEVFRTEREVVARWRWIGQVPSSVDASELFSNLLAAGSIREPAFRDEDLVIDAVAFPEDVVYGAAPEVGWVFLVWRNRDGHVTGQIARSERFDPREQGARLPSLAGLQEKRIALFGVGGIGAPLAHLLMQMRVGHLRLVDGDLVALGNAVRWPLGFVANGWNKVDALSGFATDHYPETEVVPIVWRIGASATGSQINEEDLLDQALDGADLVLDATAEPGVQLFLTDMARERDLPIITLEAREGGFGGAVVRYRAGRAACFHCFKLFQRDGRFVLPWDDRTGTIQPRGCGTPTFTGAPFDLVPISSYAARLAAQTLTPSSLLPDATKDIALLFNWWRSGDDLVGDPRWEFHELDAHPECPRCSS